MKQKYNQIILEPDELPKQWYNILADLPEPLPPPKTPEEGPNRFEILQKSMLKTALEQEFAKDRWIAIPEEIRELYIQAGRPRPLYRAKRLERALKLPENKIRLYYKREDLSPTGSHKVNTALAQVYYAAKEGYESVVTETGAGQWGSALSYAATLMNLKAIIFWVKFAHDWKPDRRTLMKLYGAEVYPSPSKITETGRKILEKNPNHPGNLGIAVSEGLEYALTHEESVYCLGSVLNHVLMHQTIIGLETIEQFKKIDDYPDVMISCLGGGSNFGGFVLPFIGQKLRKQAPKDTRFIAVQAEGSASLVKGEYRYDFADHAEMTPLLKMYTLGHRVEMPTIYAEGLRYHAASPIISYLRHKGIVEATAFPPDEQHVFDRARLFMQAEGFIPAPESSYGIAYAIDLALEAKKQGKELVIAFNVSGHGFLDLFAYRKILFGEK